MTRNEPEQSCTGWLYTYNHHRAHTASPQPPISRVNNGADHYG